MKKPEVRKRLRNARKKVNLKKLSVGQKIILFLLSSHEGLFLSGSAKRIQFNTINTGRSKREIVRSKKRKEILVRAYYSSHLTSQK